MAVTSFKKKTSSKPQHPRGTRPSLHNAQLLVSTGVPSLDALLGGGLTVGTTLLIEEDLYECYSRLLLKYFIAEGVMCGHVLVLCSANEDPNNLIQDLPGAVQEGQVGGSMPTVAEDPSELEEGESEMKIAWRYQSLPKVQSSFSNQFGHHFDLTVNMERKRIDAVDKRILNLEDTDIRTSKGMYLDLLATIEQAIKSVESSNSSTTQPGTILRVAIRSLGSPLWQEDATTDSTDLTCFFHALRSLLRSAKAVATITMPTHLFQNPAYVRRLERLSDCAIRLEAFGGSEKEHNPLYKEYHGLFHLVKLPRLNSLICHYPQTLDLAFKLKRKKFTIEKLHLPPELSETVNRAQEDTHQTSHQTGIIGRKTITGNKIDF